MKFDLILAAYIAALYGNIFVQALIVAICADMVFGCLRAIKQRCWNSSVGIDGGIRKVGMVSAVLLLTMLDMVLNVNLIGCVNEEALGFLSQLGIVKLGITELFSFLFFLFEGISVLKNMLLCGIPIPSGIRKKLSNWMHDMTDETDEDLEDPAAAH